MDKQKLPFVGVYRITDWRNLAHILAHGMFATNNVRLPQADYRFIADSDLTNRRANYSVRPPAKGKLGDYVPFYFGKRSPMLFTLVKKGFAAERDIIYLLVKIEDIVAHECEFCFTDGQANTRMTTYYVDLNDLATLDRDAIDARHWRKTEEDPDITRRKSAELLIKDHVPPQLISGIVVKDVDQEQKIRQIVVNSDFPDLSVAVRTTDYYYSL